MTVNAWPADRVERRAVSELNPYANNARLHSDAQIAQLASSITQWGWTIPILVDENDEIIAGHGRVLAARLLNLDSVPVMVATGWTDAQIRAYRIADNKLALNAAWDVEMLASELTGLLNNNFDIDLMGFEAEEFDALINVPVPMTYSGDGSTAPVEFERKDETIRTEHRCPKCGYEWSGKSQ
jgi:ParB-like chromosome segregation protein Spo0J